MWIFLNNAFLSIVANRHDDSQYLVRARVQGDLERVFGDHIQVIVTEDSDYRYRAFLDRETVTTIIGNHLQNIDYDNFKNSIAPGDKYRSRHYASVWHVMRAWQQQEHPGA